MTFSHLIATPSRQTVPSLEAQTRRAGTTGRGIISLADTMKPGPAQWSMQKAEHAERLAEICARTAAAFERSAELAGEHAHRLEQAGRSDEAARERQTAARAKQNAQRAREMLPITGAASAAQGS